MPLYSFPNYRYAPHQILVPAAVAAGSFASAYAPNDPYGEMVMIPGGGATYWRFSKAYSIELQVPVAQIAGATSSRPTIKSGSITYNGSTAASIFIRSNFGVTSGGGTLDFQRGGSGDLYVYCGMEPAVAGNLVQGSLIKEEPGETINISIGGGVRFYGAEFKHNGVTQVQSGGLLYYSCSPRGGASIADDLANAQVSGTAILNPSMASPSNPGWGQIIRVRDTVTTTGSVEVQGGAVTDENGNPFHASPGQTAYLLRSYVYLDSAASLNIPTVSGVLCGGGEISGNSIVGTGGLLVTGFSNAAAAVPMELAGVTVSGNLTLSGGSLGFECYGYDAFEAACESVVPLTIVGAVDASSLEYVAFSARLKSGTYTIITHGGMTGTLPDPTIPGFSHYNYNANSVEAVFA